MTTEVEPPKVVRTSASSIEEMRADIAVRFTNGRFEIAPDVRPGSIRTRTSLDLGNVQIDQIQAVGGHISGIKPHSFEFLFAARGAMRVTRGRSEAVARAGGSVVSFGGSGARIGIDTQIRSVAFTLRYAPALLDRCGRSLFGDGFKLDPDRPYVASSETNDALARNASSIFAELTELDKAGLASLVTASYEELLANLAIAGMYREAWANAQVRSVTPRIVERAQEIIAARAAEPLSIQDLALELGVTTRTLQLEFRRHLGCTPMQFLLNRRLLLARERLQDPNFVGSVQYVAMSCGLTNVGKFSSRYRAMFGELPSETLARRPRK